MLALGIVEHIETQQWADPRVVRESCNVALVFLLSMDRLRYQDPSVGEMGVCREQELGEMESAFDAKDFGNLAIMRG